MDHQIFVSSCVLSDPASIHPFIACFLGSIPVPIVVGWVLKEADSEMEFSVQDIYQRVSLEIDNHRRRGKWELSCSVYLTTASTNHMGNPKPK